MLKVHSIETLGTLEGPGIRLLIFLQGCNVRCMYCHNPDTWAIGKGKDYSVNDIIKLTEKERAYFENGGGVTATGGEPLVQRGELAKLFQELQKRKIHTAIETNASIFDDLTKKLFDVTDLVLLDLKHIDLEWQKKVFGSCTRAPLLIADYLEKNKKQFWLRYVLLPGYTDQKEFILRTAKYFKNFKYMKRLEILPFHTLGKEKYNMLGMRYGAEGIHPPTQKKIEDTKKLFEIYLKNVHVM